MKNKSQSILIIGDIHEDEKREKALNIAKESILNQIKDKKFQSIILLGDLFDKKPTTKERISLSNFLNSLRKHLTTGFIHFIIGNGKHTFEDGMIYEQDWINLCTDFKQHEELNVDNFCFVHAEFKGTKYITGIVSQSDRIADKYKTYISGHIHSPQCSFKNVNYVGSVYKTDFAERDDQKRIAIIEVGKINWYPIASRPMYQIKLSGKDGGVKADKATAEFLKTTPAGTEMDLKIVVDTDSSSLGTIDRQIAKIKEKFAIEYYVQEKNIKEVKVDIPKELNKDYLFETFIKAKNIPLDLAMKEYRA